MQTLKLVRVLNLGHNKESAHQQGLREMQSLTTNHSQKYCHQSENNYQQISHQNIIHKSLTEILSSI